MKAGAREPRSRRFSAIGAGFSIVIAVAIGGLAWYIVLRSEPASVVSAPTANASPAAVPSCSFPASSWIDQSGQKRPVAHLKEIEARHILWVTSNGQHGEKADFHPRNPREIAADLSCSDLQGVNLSQADLQGTELTGIDLSGADLSGAKLSGADLTHANLSGANLANADLGSEDPDAVLPATPCNCKSEQAQRKLPTHAVDAAKHIRLARTQSDLSHAQLRKAVLDGARLQYALFLDQADLRGASLQRALLFGADFTGANLSEANITQAQFDAKSDLGEAELDSLVFGPTELPDAQRVYNARHLQLLTFAGGDKKPLTALRKKFQNDGYDEQQRQITYALQRNNASGEWKKCVSGQDDAREPQRLPFSLLVSNCVGASLNMLVFDLPFQYGLNLNRPLYVVGALWLFCSILYVVIIKTRKRSAIYLVCRRECRDGRTILRRTRIVPRPVHAANVLERVRQMALREIAVWRLALFFSLESALNIGFQEFQFGRWLRLLTTREYDLKAVGWARTVSGAQSLLSLLMLALSIWGLFGQPFSG